MIVEKTAASFPYWNMNVDELFKILETDLNGLSEDEVNNRLIKYGMNVLKSRRRISTISAFIGQFKSPIIILLLFSAFLAFITGDHLDGVIIGSIILLSSILGFWQERMASNAIEKLMSMIHTQTTILRRGNQYSVPTERIVRGDIVLLSAGDLVPADCRILESNHLFVNEATFSGETFPAEKTSGLLEGELPFSKRKNMVFLGTHVVSGTAKVIVVNTGVDTEFGKISQRLEAKVPIPDFERGIRHFALILLEITLLTVLVIFAINVYLNREVLDSFLFALALAVGLTPQLLPAIISVNLSRGTKRMAEKKVIVKKLTSIENFGSMNVLCSDKTGTLTRGIMEIHSYIDMRGKKNDKILDFAFLNAYYQTGFQNPIDDVILASHTFESSNFVKLDEIPYDFVRKRLSVLVKTGNSNIIITKGAVPSILEICSLVENSEGTVLEITEFEENIQRTFTESSNKGLRCLGVAYKEVGSQLRIKREDEVNFIFLGFLLLIDPPKTEVNEVITNLKNLGVSLKIITGDNQFIAKTISEKVGLSNPTVVTGSELRKMSDEALALQANKVNVFAEVEPNQKERIILSLRKTGNVVGYIGDGINDASALHAADVGISVDSAVDIAKEASEIILLEKSLVVLLDGIYEGRRTFTNSLKYVYITISANFGNMISMMIASVFLPFLPLLPTQVLMINFMTDFPSMTIATDNVDLEMVNTPKRWNIKEIVRFMTVFGLLSMLFDLLSFYVLIFVLQAQESEFQTGWFLVSVVTEIFILFVIRTRKIFYQSIPSQNLLISSTIVLIVTLLLPLSPLQRLFGFSFIPIQFMMGLGIIILLYIITTELTKRIFYKRENFFL
ncbi:MAG: magnesium-translocating P-type ATPase [Promethearchaeota archaeon]